MSSYTPPEAIPPMSDTLAIDQSEAGAHVAEQSPPSAAIHSQRQATQHQATQATIDSPTRYQRPTQLAQETLRQAREVSFTIDEDMILAAQDQARSHGVPFAQWCQQTLNDALRTYLGV